MNKSIKFLVMDVDGTLTDGKIYMGADGEAFKAFDIKDGYALHTLLKEHGIIPVIITARKSPMVEHRCKELGVTEIHQGVKNKLECLKGILNKYSSVAEQYDLSNVAYIGDDLLDLQCIKPIKAADGMAGCPSDAVKGVMTECNYVSCHKGGEGAVRDFAEYIIEHNEENLGSGDLEERCTEAINYLSRLNEEDTTLGKHIVNEKFYYNVQEYITTGEKEKPFESHCEYVDIQLLLFGEEIMEVADARRLQVAQLYDSEVDRTLYTPNDMAAKVVLRPESVMVLFPNDAHRSMCYNGKESVVKKIVGKIKIQ